MTAPSTPGTFTISLDCEGRWGMADHITGHHRHHVTRAKLRAAYRRLVDLFARYDVPTTFAFVMAFTLDEEEQREFAGRLTDVTVDGANWLRCFRADEQAGDTDGWFCPEALDMVREDGRHEIGCHGFTHALLGEGRIAPEDAASELANARAVIARKGLRDCDSFVFPRNLVGNLPALKAAGFTAYRAAPPAAFGRIGSLAREFHLIDRAQSQPPQPDPSLATYPSGYFLNWRFGLRRRVPMAVTHRRWRSILADASRRGLSAGLFLHPHNIIDAPETFDLLEAIVADAARRRDRGELAIVPLRGLRR